MAKAKKKQPACRWQTMGGRGFPCLRSDEHEDDHIFADFGLNVALVLEAAQETFYRKGNGFMPAANDRLSVALEAVKRAVPRCGAVWPKDASVTCTLLAGHNVQYREYGYVQERHAFRDQETEIEWNEPEKAAKRSQASTEDRAASESEEGPDD